MRVTSDGRAFRGQHYLLTRFNVRLTDGPAASDAWLRARLALFERFCLPSVLAQSSSGFEWIVFIDAESPDWFVGALAELARGRFDVVSVNGNWSLMTPSRVLADRAAGPQVITSRLDNDDCIAVEYVERVQQSVTAGAREFINFTRGAQYSRGRFFVREDPSNAFISLVEELRPSVPPQTVFVDSHDRLHRYGPVRQVVAPLQWVQVVHDANLANVVRGLRVPARSVEPFFGVRFDVAQESAARFAASYMGSRTRMVLRVARKPSRWLWLWRVGRTRFPGRSPRL